MIDIFEEKIKDEQEKIYTWVSRDGRTKRRLDYIFINSKITYNYNILKCNMDDSSLKKGISDHKILGMELKRINKKEYYR